MARLSRITQVIFGSSASDIGVFGSAALGTPTTSTVIATIMAAASWATGWLTAVLGASKFPAIEDMNAVSYVHSTQIAYILQQGIPEYAAGTTYYTNQVCTDPGTFNLYGSIANNNLGNALSDATKWQLLGNLANIASLVNFYTGGVTAGAAAAQTLATITPAGLSLANNGSTVVCTAGFACPAGGLTFAIGGTAAKAGKIEFGGAYIDPPLNHFVLNETIFLTRNVTNDIWVITDAPVLGSAAAKAASDNTKATLASVSGATTINNLAKFIDNVGTVADGGSVASNQIQTPLGIGSTLIASTANGATAAGATTAASNLVARNPFLNGSSTGTVATGDSLTGTYQYLQTVAVTDAGNAGLLVPFQRVA